MRIDDRQFWGVRDPGPNSTLVDVLFPMTLSKMPEYVAGAGSRRMRQENHRWYDDRDEALADARKRLGRTAA